MRGLMQQRSLTVRDLWTRVEQNFGHKSVITATATGETTATWQQVTERAGRLATVLDVLGVAPSARVGTFAWNTQRHVELYLAVPASGRVLHTLNHRLHPDDLRYIINNAADEVVFVDRSLLIRLGPLLTGLGELRHIVVMDDGGGEPIPDDPRTLDYEQLLQSARPVTPDQPLDEDDAASLCYTSGTTGRPKGVLYSHRAIALHALMLLGVDSFAISERDVVMPIVPMFHVNAWGLPYAAMLAGSTLVLPGPAMSSQALVRQLQRHRVTFAAGVPTIWRGMQPLLPDADLSSLRMAVSGGGALPDALSRSWEAASGLPLTSSWGMTETSPLVACARLGTVHEDLDADERRRVLSLPGPNVPFTQLRIVDDDGRVLERDGRTAGELQVAGPTVAAGYFGDDSHASFSADGWLRTGDVATLDRYGYLRIVDRTKDLVKSGGEWISSVALENEIMAHPAVSEAAVIAVPDERWGERPLACVVPTPGQSLDADELRAFLATRVSPWWIPEQVWVLDEIPKTATGKFAKLTLRRQRAELDPTVAAVREGTSG
jgi:fatty-acyl-CoA synthase